MWHKEVEINRIIASAPSAFNEMVKYKGHINLSAGNVSRLHGPREKWRDNLIIFQSIFFKRHYIFTDRNTRIDWRPALFGALPRIVFDTFAQKQKLTVTPYA